MSMLYSRDRGETGPICAPAPRSNCRTLRMPLIRSLQRPTRAGTTARAGRSSTNLRAIPLFHLRPQPARCLQTELAAFLNQLIQCSTQNNNSWQGSARGTEVSTALREEGQREEDPGLGALGKGMEPDGSTRQVRQRWLAGAELEDSHDSHIQAALRFAESELISQSSSSLFPPPLLLRLSKFPPQQNLMPRFSKSALPWAPWTPLDTSSHVPPAFWGHLPEPFTGGKY